MRKYIFFLIENLIFNYINVCKCNYNTNEENNNYNSNTNINEENKTNKTNKTNKNNKFKDNNKSKMENIIDITEYKIDESKLKDIVNEIKKVNEEDRVFIQSDTEGKVFNIISTLQIANIIDINKHINIYYNFKNGNFEKIKSTSSIELKLFEVNKNFKGTYIHLGDIVDRCTGNHQCLKSLLYLLYLKQELGDKIKLICGNHELTDYSLGNPGCNCCKNIKDLITLIVFRAISKGQIKYLDKISIGTTDYILTHKVIYKEDIDQIKYFLKNKMKEKKDLKNYNIFQLIDVVNDNFKKYFTNFFNIKVDIYQYSSCFDQISSTIPKNPKTEYIVIGDRVGNNYNICLENQICGHDHHKINECYIKDKNILFIDNYSYDVKTYITKKYQKPMVNIHFFNINENLADHKIFNIIQNENNLDINIY